MGKSWNDLRIQITPIQPSESVQSVIIWPRIISGTELYISYSRLSTSANINFTVHVYAVDK